MGFSWDILLPPPCTSILSPELLMLCFFSGVFLEQLKAFGRFMVALSPSPSEGSTRST